MNDVLEGQTAGRIITFYSYKGGTGRSMALANVAYLLANDSIDDNASPIGPNRGVLVIDWDLEAPGLHRYFRPFLPGAQDDSHEIYDREQPGLIDLFLELGEASPSSMGLGEDERSEMSALERSDVENRFIVSTSIPNLSFMKAGRFDDGYSARVSNFRWDLFYE